MLRDLQTVRGLADDYRIDSVELEDGQFVLHSGWVTERYDTVEEACAAIRASWRRRDEVQS
jgi:hypothetical protein